MNLFIDTNIFLSFFHFTSDDLEELKKLSVLIEKKEIILFLPDQVITEFYRNRENKIADAIKRLKDQRLNFQFPQFCKDYPQYLELRRLQREYERIHSDLVAKSLADIDEKNLKADSIILPIIGHAIKITCDKDIIQLARERMEIGNPPGKRGKDDSLGDAINWEALIKGANKQDISFISDDGDYCSPLDDSKFNAFLLQEWQAKKGSSLIFYKNLSNFFKQHFPDIKLASEIEKDLLIRNLASSSIFMKTHEIIGRLNQYDDFTPAQINAIIDASISNSQIYWIRYDNDVNGFLKRIIKGKKKQLDQRKLSEFIEMLEPPEVLDENEVPF